MITKIKSIKKAIGSKVVSLFDQGIVSGTNFIIAILISKFAGVEVYGKFAIIWLSFFLIHGFLTSFIGLPYLVLGNKEADRDEYCKRNTQLLNVIIAILWLISTTTLFVLDKAVTQSAIFSMYFLIPTVVLLFVKHEQQRRYFFAKGKSKHVLITDFLAYFLQIPIFIFLGIFAQLGLYEVLFTMMITVLTANVAFHLLSKEFKIFNTISNLPIKKNWQYSKYLIATNVVQWTSSNFLLLSLGAVLGTGAVGTVRLVQNLMGVLHVFFITIENVVPAKASYLLNKHSFNHFRTYFKAVIKKTSIVFGAVLLLIWIFKSNILEWVYGAEFVTNVNLLSAFVVLYVLVFAGTLAQIYLKATEQNKAIFLGYILSLATSIICSNYLIENYHVMGYVYGLMLFQILGLSVYLLTLKNAKA